MSRSVCVIGLGYIGLPTSALIADSGYQVVGVDNNSTIVDMVNDGMIHIVEEGLPELVKSAVLSKKLSARTFD